jgi:hypothetical protein
MIARLLGFGSKPTVPPATLDDIACVRQRRYPFCEVLTALIPEHGQDFDALASELGVPADIDFARMAFEAARMASVRVNFTSIEQSIRFLRAAASGGVFSSAPEAQHNVDWGKLQSAGPTYRTALRGLSGWFSYYDGTAGLVFWGGDFSDASGKSYSMLTPFLELKRLEASQGVAWR